MDDQFVSIEKQSHHFYILNSQYYDLALPGRSISKLRQNYRDLLLHNAVIADQHVMGIGNPEQEPFLEWRGRIHINVPAFLRVTERAVLKFLSVVDTVVPGSDQERVNALKR